MLHLLKHEILFEQAALAGLPQGVRSRIGFLAGARQQRHHRGKHDADKAEPDGGETRGRIDEGAGRPHVEYP